MLTEKQKAQGWKEGTAAEFLGLSEAESQLVEIRLRAAQALKAQREKAGLSQKEAATRLGTQQPAIARLENAEGSTTLDKIFLAILEIGGTRADLADLITQAAPPMPKTLKATGKPVTLSSSVSGKATKATKKKPAPSGERAPAYS